MLSNFATITNTNHTLDFPPPAGSFVSSVGSAPDPQTGGQAGAQTVVINVGSWPSPSGTLKVFLVGPNSSEGLGTAVDVTSTSIAHGTSISGEGTYVAQVGPGAVYVVCTSSALSGSPLVNLSTGPADEGFDVTVFGALGDGVNPDDEPIQTAIYAAYYLRTVVPDTTDVGYNVGVTLYFPPGTYNITDTLVFPSDVTTVNVRFQGYPSSPTKDNASAPRSILSYSTATGPMILCRPTEGFSLQDLGLTFTDASYSSGTGMIDLAGTSPSAGVFHDSMGIFIQNCTFYPSSTGLLGCDRYLYLDGCESVVVTACAFYGAEYAIQGFDTAGEAFCNGATISNQTRFAKQKYAPILNPGEAWSFNGCIVEPNYDNHAAFIRITAGAMSKALSIIGCWMGDNRTGDTETWVEFAGQGLFMAANHIELYYGTTGLALQTLSGGNHGINLQSNQFYNSVTDGGVSGTAVDLGSDAYYTDFVFLGNSVGYNILPVKSFSVFRSGSLFATPGGINISAGIVSFTPIPDPATTITATPTGSGSGPDGIYHYRLAFVTTTGETALGTTTGYADTSGTAQTITVSTTASPTSSGVSAIKVYRTKAGPTSDYYYVGDMTGLSFTDSVPDSSLTLVCTYKSNTTAGKFFVGANYAGGISGNNLSLGINALPAITYGVFNTAFGWSAGKLMTTGNYNSVFGTQAGNAITNGSSNSFFGYNAGVAVTTGSFNMLLGGNAGENITTGDYNLCFGYKAGVGLDGHPLTTGSYNTFLGAYSGPLGSSGGTLALAAGIGYGAMPGESHLMALGGTDTLQTKVVINGNTADAQLQVNAATDTIIGVIVKGKSTRTSADLQRWESYTGDTLASVDAHGDMSCKGLALGNLAVASGATYTADVYGGTFIESTRSTAGIQTITLPSSPVSGQVFIIIDQAGNAGTNNITVNGGGHFINGSFTASIDTDYGHMRLRWSSNSNAWFRF